jgi:hypothetical protein
MPQADKASYYQALKRAGVKFEKHYRDYTTDEFREAYESLVDAGAAEPFELETLPDLPQPGDRRQDVEDDDLRQKIAELSTTVDKLVALQAAALERQLVPQYTAPVDNTPKRRDPKLVSGLDPNQHAGITLNSHTGDDVIEVDQFGNQWFQKEVAKPGFPRPRGRRVLRYDDPGTVIESIKVGEYTETFEVAGDGRNSRPSEVKITLPSFQTGIYRAPNMPFKVHTYNGVRGFDLEDVQRFYGGNDLVPSTIKRCYVSTDLCYEIQSTIRAIENEYRERVLNVKGL